jgi:hypothetical protein
MAELYPALNSFPRQVNVSEHEQIEWDRRRNKLLAVLLAATGKKLEYDIGEVEIQEGGMPRKLGRRGKWRL